MATFPTLPAGTTVCFRYKGDSIANTVDGSLISAWPEFDGKGDATQGTAGDQPAVVLNALNGHKGADFDGTNVMQLPSAVLNVLNGEDDWTWFTVLVMQEAAADTVYVGFLSTGGSATITRASNTTRTATDYLPGLAYRRNDADSITTIQSALADELVVNTAYTLTGTVDHIAGTSQVWTNGTSVATGAAEVGIIDNTTALGGSIGGRTTSGANFMRGLILETVLLKGPVSADTRSKVHSYFQDEYAHVHSDYVASVATVKYRPTSTAAAGGWTAATVDPFTRTSDTTLGSTPEGYVWTAQVGTWGTNGTQAYSVTVVDKDIATIDPGLVNCDVSAVVPTLVANGYWGLVGAYASAGNYYHAQVDPSGFVSFLRTVGGTETKILFDVASVTAGQVVRITRTGGNQWTLYVNGAQVGQTAATETSHGTATQVGMRHGSTAAGVALRWDDFTAKTPASLHGALSDQNTATIITGSGV